MCSKIKIEKNRNGGGRRRGVKQKTSEDFYISSKQEKEKEKQREKMNTNKVFEKVFSRLKKDEKHK